MRRNSDGTSKAIGWRHPKGWLAVALTLGLAGCSVTAGEEAPSVLATSTSSPEAVRAGDRINGSGLPKPVSNLVAFDGLVVYYSSSRDQRLELVAVDPTIGSVVWRYRATMPYQAKGVAIGLDAADEGVPVLFRPTGPDGTFYVQLLDRSGAPRWSRSVDSPLGMPEPCRDRICVDTVSGPKSMAVADGRRYAGGTPPSKNATVIGSSGDRVIGALVSDKDDGTDPAEGFTGVPRLNAGASWSRSLAELYGKDSVTSYTGWAAYRYGDNWVTWLGHTIDFARDEPEFPYTKPVGSVAGLASDDGTPRWHRSETRLCYEFSTERVAVLCSPKSVYPSEDEVGVSVASRFAEIDPKTGKDRFVLELDEPLNLFDLDARSLRLGPDEYLIADGSSFRKIDFAARQETNGSGREVGWCPAELEVAEVQDVAGEPAQFGDVTAGAPCVLGDKGKPADQLLAPVIDGSLPAVEEVSVVEAGPWTMWIEDGELTGVARNS